MPKTSHYLVSILARRKGGRGPGKKIIDASYKLSPSEFRAVEALHQELEAAATPKVTPDTVVTVEGQEYRLGDLIDGGQTSSPSRSRTRQKAADRKAAGRKKASYKDTPESQARKALRIDPRGPIPKDKRDAYQQKLKSMRAK